DPERMQPVPIAGEVEEAPEGGGIPGLDGIGLHAPAWRVSCVTRVASEAAPTHGVSERSVQDRVDVVDRATVQARRRPITGLGGGMATEQRGDSVLADPRSLVELAAQHGSGVLERRP